MAFATHTITALIVAGGLAAAPALAQTNATYEPPRTAAGKPDLQGVWSSATATSLERPDGYPLVITPEQADEIEGGTLFHRRLATEASYVDPAEGAPEKGRALPPVGNYDVAWTDPGTYVTHINGELRSSWIVYPDNGKIPDLTENGQALRASSPRRRGTGYDHPEERGLGERCVFMLGGPPLRSSLYNNNVQIVQTPDNIMMMVEMIHEARIVRVNDEHRADGVTPWMGDSIAHWDGDTLVVETTGVHPDQRRDQTLLSADGKITERFTRISEKQILYQYEINDPAVYADVWRAETALNLMSERLYEYACHEGNYGLENILSGGRQNDREGVAHTDGDKRDE
jgi:hypothetical protein